MSGNTANQIARGKLRDENERLTVELAQSRLEIQKMQVVMACLVKRLGAVLADKSGWRVLVTDEEFEGMDGMLEAERSEPDAGIILRVIKREQGADSE